MYFYIYKNEMITADSSITAEKASWRTTQIALKLEPKLVENKDTTKIEIIDICN